MQSAEADSNWSRLLAETTEAGNEFQVLTVQGKKEQVKASSLLYKCLYLKGLLLVGRGFSLTSAGKEILTRL